jgi:hypothetical protein
MTKQEIYDKLTDMGKKPEKGINSYKLEELEKMYDEATGVAKGGDTSETEVVDLNDPEAVYDFLCRNSKQELKPIEEYSHEELIEMCEAIIQAHGDPNGEPGLQGDPGKPETEADFAKRQQAEAEAKAKADAEKAAREAAEQASKDQAKKQKQIPVLHFKNAGWCEKLKKSYFRGRYQPKSIEEYEALKEFTE